jgi:hypothetical protein
MLDKIRSRGFPPVFWIHLDPCSNWALDAGSGSAFGIRIWIPDPDSLQICLESENLLCNCFISLHLNLRGQYKTSLILVGILLKIKCKQNFKKFKNLILVNYGTSLKSAK